MKFRSRGLQLKPILRRQYRIRLSTKVSPNLARYVHKNNISEIRYVSEQVSVFSASTAKSLALTTPGWQYSYLWSRRIGQGGAEDRLQIWDAEHINVLLDCVAITYFVIRDVLRRFEMFWWLFCYKRVAHSKSCRLRVNLLKPTNWHLPELYAAGAFFDQMLSPSL